MTTKTNTIDLTDRAEHNPMVSPDGCLFPVSDVLESVSLLLGAVAEGNISITQTGSNGVSVILDTCAAALRQMQEAKP
jgi:hypothetical protein